MRADVMIERIAYFVSGKVPGDIDVRHLSRGVYAGIRATRTVDERFLAAELFNGGLQHGLNTQTAILSLPAHKWTAIIFQG
jgi:hypothetical protein